MPQNPHFERPLVWLKPRFLGDAVMATPLLGALSDRGIRPTILASPHVQELLSAEPGMDIVQAASLRGARDVLRESKRLRQLKFDSVFLVNRSFRSALTSLLAGIPTRIGHTTEGRGPLLTHRARYDDQRLECECYGDLARRVAIEGSFTSLRLTLAEAESDTGMLLAKGATIGIQPGATAAHKLVSPEVLAALVDRFVDQGHTVALLGAESEREATNAVLERTKSPLVDLVGACSLRESMGVVANLQLVIGGDTGLMHIATALGTPNVAVFGPTPIKKWGHKLPHTRALQAPESNALKIEVDPIWDAAFELLSG